MVAPPSTTTVDPVENGLQAAIERNVPKEKIAKALDINVRSISRKVQLLDGICTEAVGLLKIRCVRWRSSTFFAK
jgi:hypothetical protein